jgi:prepilin-type N-terminal cleavage/methylation domain-containing protein
MVRVLRAPERPRPAFTMVELLVVLGIMAVLLALASVAVVKTLATMQGQATDSTLQKVASELNKQLKIVTEQALYKESIPPNVVTLAGGDTRRARVIWLKLRLIQEFPTTYAEAHSPIPSALLQPNGPLALTDLPPKNIFNKNLPVAANNPATESSACLLLSLTSGRGGMRWDAENTLGAGSVLDTDGDGAREIVDTWGNAIYFVRCPFDQTTPWGQDLNPGGMKAGNNDSQDPEGLLTNATWINTPYGNSTLGALFSLPPPPSPPPNGVHPVQAGASWQNLNPIVASVGPDKAKGTGDDRYSYRLKSMGSGGER